MKNQITAVKSNRQVQVDSPVDEQILKVGMAALGIFSCAAGLWAAACIAAGIFVSGGPGAFAMAWLKAVTASV